MSLSVVVVLAIVSIGYGVKTYKNAKKTKEDLEEQRSINESLNETLRDVERLVGDLESSNEKLSDEVEDLKKDFSDKVQENKKLSDEVKDLKSKYQNLKSKQQASAKKKGVTTSSSSSSSAGWVKMNVNASAYTTEANGDKLGGGNITSTGKVPKVNRTIAVDPKVIPYGSLIQYNGVTYVAEDTGGMIKGNKVDIFMGSMPEVTKFGRRDIEILVKKP